MNKKGHRAIVDVNRNPKFHLHVWNNNPTRYGIGKGKNEAPLCSHYLNPMEVVDQVELILKLNPRWRLIQLFNEKGELLEEWQNQNIGT